MDKNQNLTSFQELTTTELNQITGGDGGKISYIALIDILITSHKDFISQYNYKKNKIEIQELSVLFSSFCIHHSKYLTKRLDLDR